MRISVFVSFFILTLLFIECKKENNKSNQPTTNNITPNGWVQVTPGSNNVDFNDIYLTESKLFATLPFTLCSSSDAITWNTSTITNVWCVHGDANGKIYLGSGGFKVSLDSGNTWTQKNNGLTNLNVFSISSSTTGIYLSTSTGGIFFSADGGDNWIPAGLSGSAVGKVAILNNKLFAISSSSLFTSSNNGVSWTSVPISTISMWVNNIIVAGNNLLATTNGETYISTDSGINWSIASGLGPYNSIFSFGNKVLSVTGNLNIKYSSDAGLTWASFDDGLPTNRNLSCYCLNSTYAYVLEMNSKKIFRRKF